MRRHIRNVVRLVRSTVALMTSRLDKARRGRSRRAAVRRLEQMAALDHQQAALDSELAHRVRVAQAQRRAQKQVHVQARQQALG